MVMLTPVGVAAPTKCRFESFSCKVAASKVNPPM